MEENMEKENGLVEIDESSKKSEKLFTQEEVNEIVKKRLNRQKVADNDVQELETREKTLKDRENRFSCKEYLLEKGYPAELLNVIDTTDVDNFKKKADKANDIYHSMQQASNVAPLAELEGTYDATASAFNNTKHEPKGYWATDPKWRK